MGTDVRASGGRWAVVVALLLVLIGATVANLPAWTIPLRIAGWAAIVFLFMTIRNPGQAWQVTLRRDRADFTSPVSRRFATVSLLVVGVPVLVLLAAAIVWRFV
jgi:hypothetical protein